MRRSEMIELIVYEALSWDGLSTSGVPVEEVANDMLRVCEKMGMLPPKPQSANSDNPIFLELENYTKLLYNWEPEDE